MSGMPPFLVRAIMPHVSGLPEDVTVNDFAFSDALTSVFAAAAVEDFYLGANTTLTTAARLSTVVSRVALACSTEVYALNTQAKLAGGPLGSPTLVTPFTMGAVSTAENMVSEVQVCLSFRADYGDVPEEDPPSRPRARRRGRVYVGPLTRNSLLIAGNNVPRPSVSCIEDLLDAAERLADPVVLNSTWGVWSRADAIVREIVEASVDDAFDTQRRRGEPPTTRTTRAV